MPIFSSTISFPSSENRVDTPFLYFRQETVSCRSVDVSSAVRLFNTATKPRQTLQHDNLLWWVYLGLEEQRFEPLLLFRPLNHSLDLQIYNTASLSPQTECLRPKMRTSHRQNFACRPPLCPHWDYRPFHSHHRRILRECLRQVH